MSRPVAPLPSLATQLHALADRLDTLAPAEVVGELEAIKTSVLLAATPTAVAPMGADPCALLTDKTVGHILGVPVGTIVLLRQRGLLPGVPVGDKYVRTRRRDLESFVATLPTALYSRKYANQIHAHATSPHDARGDAPPPPPPRLDAGPRSRGSRRHK